MQSREWREWRESNLGSTFKKESSSNPRERSMSRSEIGISWVWSLTVVPGARIAPRVRTRSVCHLRHEAYRSPNPDVSRSATKRSCWRSPMDLNQVAKRVALNEPSGRPRRDLFPLISEVGGYPPGIEKS